ncbi:uncharacterized protein LOC118405086 [Branchiostoma floridae]|uniref:Uncharacterized protein LOC118405086 n=1 Tax=Branchiostoma floridae TaxID=7739 RepID=A0A9J7KFG4_BRAFL|nr:uncharacterized protein LOC118405086 [Branchiostoma floridae]
MENILGGEFSSIPAELRGPEMATLYAEACRQGSLPVHSTRAQVVGQYRSGKTCFINRLMGEPIRLDEPITDGIQITPDVHTKTWKKSPEEIDEFGTGMAGLLLQSRQETKTSAEESDEMAETSPSQKKDTTESREVTKPHAQEGTEEVLPKTQDETGSVTLSTEITEEDSRGSLEKTGTSKPGQQAVTSSDNILKHQGQTKMLEEDIRDVSVRPTVIPGSVAETVKRMQDAGFTKLKEDLGTVKHPRLSFWDFGGQATYYGTHHCFITPRGVYILVMSLLQKLSYPVPDMDNKASVDNLRTGGDYMDHWLNSVCSHTQHLGKPEGKMQPQNTGRPPVVVVLTNKDKVSQEYITEYKEDIRSHLEGKAAGMLVMPEIFAVDNTTEDAVVDEIRNYLLQVARGLPHMGEEIPISWLHLMSKLRKKREEGKRFLKFQEIAKLAKHPDINITDKHILALVLSFFHDRGDIIFIDEPSLREDVTLQPQVMIDVFKTIITVPQYQQDRQTDPEVRKMWERLENDGILSDKLLTRIWEKKDQQLDKPFLLQHKSFLKALMEKFYLICNATPVGDVMEESHQEEIYFVPALLSCEKDNTMLYPGNMHICPQALYFVFSEKFLPSGMFCRLQALCVRRFGLQESSVFAGCGRFPTDDEEQAFVITKVNHYLKVELLSSSNILTEGLRVRKFLSSALFEIKEKWIPCIQYELCCSTQEDGGEPAFRVLPTGEGELGQRWGFPSLFRTVWMSEGPHSELTENSGGDGPVILQPKGDPNLIVGMHTIGPVLDTMEQGGGLTLDQCDHIRSQLTPVQRIRTVLEIKRRGEVQEYMLGAAVEMCLPEFKDLFRREERGKELMILHTDDYTAEFVSPLQTAMSESGVPHRTEMITSTDSITEKTVELLLNTKNRMVILVISPQALHHKHWSNLDYEFPVRNERLLLPVLLYPQGSRDQIVRVLQRRAPVLDSMNREEIEMKGGLVSERKLRDIVQKLVIDDQEEARLYQISKALGEEWTRLGQEMGLEKSVLDEMKGDDDTQAAMQMLKAWRIKTPHGPLHYLPQLEEALQNIARPDLAAAVQETYKEYRNGLKLTKLSPDMNEDRTWSLRLPGEGKYLCRRTDLGVVTPYLLHVTYRSANWSDNWQQVGEWMPVGPLVSIQCEDVEGPVDILLPHVLHLADNKVVTREDLQVVHVVGDSIELLPVTELTSSHAVTRFKKGSLFGVVGRTTKVFSVSRNCLLMAFRSLDDSDLSTLKAYIVSNTKDIKETITEDAKVEKFEPCGYKTCHLNPGDFYYLEGSVTNGGSEMVTISPKRLMFEDTLETNKFYEPFEVMVTADIWMDNTSLLHLELLKDTSDEAEETEPLSQLILGRYKRSRIAEGVDSGHSTPTELESVRRHLESTKLTDHYNRTDDLHPPQTLQPEAVLSDIRPDSSAAGSGAKPVVLLLSDEYGTSKGGVSTIHRQMASFLALKGAKVYSTVLDANQRDKDDAAADGVELIFPDTVKGDDRKPDLKWLTFDHQSRFPNLPTNVDFIVGHVNITSRAAKHIKAQRLPRAKIVQVTHVIPEDVARYKSEEKELSIQEEKAGIEDDLQHADVVVSVGPLVYDYYKNEMRQEEGHQMFLPEPSAIFQNTQVKYIDTETKVVLSIGRVKGVERVKGYDLAAKTMSRVIEELPNTKWRGRGISHEDFPESKAIIQANMKKGTFQFTPLKYGTQEDLSKDMQQAHVVLMPSRAEPFGLVGLEAIAAGVPVLVSHKSGLAWFLREDSDFDRPIVEIEDDDDKAAETLAKRIIKVLKDGGKEFEAANKLKKRLLASKYWKASHSKFLEIFGL